MKRFVIYIFVKQLLCLLTIVNFSLSLSPLKSFDILFFKGKTFTVNYDYLTKRVNMTIKYLPMILSLLLIDSSFQNKKLIVRFILRIFLKLNLFHLPLSQYISKSWSIMYKTTQNMIKFLC